MPYTPAVIGLDIYHPHSYKDGLLQKLLANKNFVGICDIDSVETDPDTYPSHEMPKEQLGFADLPRDPDNVIRRNLLLFREGDICKTKNSFGLQVALKYLALEEDSISLEDNKRKKPLLKIGKQIFSRLEPHSSGYQLDPRELGGFQIMINPRYKAPKTLPLKSFLSDQSISDLSNLINNRIILIGGDQDWQDRHFTSLKPAKLPGVILQAHIVSQILDAIQKNKGIMRWLPKWFEALWFFVWTLIVILWASFLRSSKLLLGLKVAGVITGLFIVCFTIFCLDIWIPLIPTVLAVMIGTAITLFLPMVSSGLGNFKE
jgi:CHASE2 domain-containing sensor protein